jgi:hypothetical protein
MAESLVFIDERDDEIHQRFEMTDQGATLQLNIGGDGTVSQGFTQAGSKGSVLFGHSCVFGLERLPGLRTWPWWF